ncbi:MAG: tRNA uridine-5-carboxymethylaminomethyl(34) synthesis GTPase MnmE, partial [Thermoprotei archaeon]
MDGSSDTIAAIATAPGTGALAVVRLTGPKAAEIADRIFRSLPGRRGVLSSSESHRCHVG